MIATANETQEVVDRMEQALEWLKDHDSMKSKSVNLSNVKTKIEFGQEDYSEFRRVFAGNRATRRRSDYGRMTWLSVIVDGIEFEVTEPSLPAKEELDV